MSLILFIPNILIRVVVGLLLLVLPSVVGFPRTFGNNVFHKYNIKATGETTVFEHTNTAGMVGMLTYFWTTAGPHATDRYISDTTIMRYYIDHEENASLVFTVSMACGSGVGLESAAYYNQNDTDPTTNCSEWKHPGPQVCGMDLLDGWPWSVKYVGKNGAESSWTNNMRVPFSKSIRVTSQVAANSQSVPEEFRRPDLDEHTTSSAFMIFSGIEGKDDEIFVTVGLGSVRLPSIGKGSLRLRLQRLHNYAVPGGGVVPLAEYQPDTSDALSANFLYGGAVFMVTVGFDGMRHGLNIEGCWWALTTANATLVPPLNDGVLLVGTGVEDFFGAAYGLTWTERLFHNDVSGLTHVRGGPTPNIGPGGGHPPGASFFSAYRFFDKDPLFFRQKLGLYWRNGGQGKCQPATPPSAAERARSQNNIASCSESKNCVNSYVWFYTFKDGG